MAVIVDDLIRHTGLYLGLDDRVRLFQTSKRFSKDKEKIIDRLKVIKPLIQLIFCEGLESLLPEVTDCLFRIETTPRRAENNDKLEVYRMIGIMDRKDCRIQQYNWEWGFSQI